jgi:large subunit ribosomal protein L15e
MSARKYIQASFAKSYAERAQVYRSRVSAWKKMSTVERAEKPTNPGRAHSIGYRAKKEFVIVRVRVAKGRRRLGKRALGRKPAKKIKFRPLNFPLSRMAEMKAEKEFNNLKAIGSYFVGEDGMSKYFEVVLHNEHQGSAPNRPKAK